MKKLGFIFLNIILYTSSIAYLGTFFIIYTWGISDEYLHWQMPLIYFGLFLILFNIIFKIIIFPILYKSKKTNIHIKDFLKKYSFKILPIVFILDFLFTYFFSFGLKLVHTSFYDVFKFIFYYIITGCGLFLPYLTFVIWKFYFKDDTGQSRNE